MNELKLKFLSFQEKLTAWQFKKIWYHADFDVKKREKEIMAPMPNPELYAAALAKLQRYKARNVIPPEHDFMYAEPLLTAAQEHHLFRKYNFLKYKFKQLLEKTTLDKVDSKVITKLENYYSGLNQIRQQLVNCNARLVMGRVKANRVISKEFGLSDGRMGLIRAVDYFNWRKKNRKTKKPLKFSTYAFYAIQDSVRRCYYYDTRGILTNAEEIIDIVNAEDLEEKKIIDSDNKNTVQRLLKCVTKREQEIISLHFGVNGQRQHTFEEISRMFGVTRERIRQIMLSGFKRIRNNEVVEYEP